ncbi:MAG TPA: thioredoxin domain-containing protein [Bacteroidia bacterium]|nr:thioredoxin domain-containing protein [Bacteroidia bacterium]
MRNNLFLATLLALTSCASEDSQALDPKEFSDLIHSSGDEQVIDLRATEELTDGQVAGAVQMDWNSGALQKNYASLDKERPVLVYCRTDNRSIKAAEFLKNNGFKEVYVLAGGITKWKEQGLPLEIAPPPPPPLHVSKATSLYQGGKIDLALYNSLIKSTPVVLVDFSAVWCGPCKILAPKIAEIEHEEEDILVFTSDVDRDKEVAMNMGISAMPTLLLYKNGEIFWKQVGLVDKSVIVDQIKKARL